ncbi:MAG: Rubrerythrin [Planctomycetes bacterium ADurb.Bin401]|nr:MAG: Rubrerythrin [Planctomycetes bacterium ADurb.Bin401]
MDIFEFAKEKEKFSENYYRRLSQKTTHEGFRNIFNMLAAEEAGHYKIVEEMQKHQQTQIADSPILSDAKKVFDSIRVSAERFNFDISEVQLYKKARRYEEESETFYRRKAEESEDPVHKDIFNKLADQEHKHYILLENIYSFAERPEYFLENAEIYRFDDYVDGVL